MRYIQRCSMFLLATLLFCTGLVPAVVSANEAGETITFYHHDHLGTPIMATNEAGEVLWIREYTAFGDPKTQGAAVAVGYAGHEYYPESNLTNMGARWYNSELGRFMSPDPVGFNAGNTLSFNRYLYGNNNPYTFYDPDGEVAFVFIEAGSATIGLNSATNNFREGNYGAAAVDLVFVVADIGLMPFPVPGIFGVLRQSAKRAPDVIGVVKKVGRSGKQARLKELANDPKLGKADRGWIKQEQNAIERGSRKSIRNPPGKDLAHERGREAAKGYDYGNSNLQDRDLHRLQHKYDNFGRSNAERPPE